jgi:nucleoside-diphosphate-sugar epimerase
MSKNGVCTEESLLMPLSLYGRTKALAERELLEHTDCTVFRLATAFGVSPRMRFDLLINDLTYQAVKNHSAIVYESDFVRPFVHVHDAARAFLYAMNRTEMTKQIYNVVGENCTKRSVCNKIHAATGAYFHFAEVGHDADARNYEVSPRKLYDAGFAGQNSVLGGINEMVHALAAVKTQKPYSNV